MNKKLFGINIIVLPLLMVIMATSCASSDYAEKILLKDNWLVQQSTKVNLSGEKISEQITDVSGWYKAAVPSTIMGVLTENGLYKDLFVGDNLKKVDKAQFDTSWWYRNEFVVPKLNKQQHVHLTFDGISYYANVWLNGKLIGSRDSVFGTFRRFDFDITDLLNESKNVLAVEVFRQRPGDFGLGFVDWNPRPPDENLGIWREVYLKITGNVGMENSYIQSKVNVETLKEAWLTVNTELVNYSSEAVSGKLKGKIENIEFTYPVQLNPGERKAVSLTSDEIPALHIKDPRLWWCNNLGEPNLYNLNLSFETGRAVSDSANITFGIRDIKSYYTAKGHKGFKLNGKEVLIKGAGWTDDLFLRDTEKSNEIQVQYVKHMNLNTIRFENIWGTSQNIYDLCDKYGLLAMVGWSCHWEWDEYLGKPCDDYGGIKTKDEINLMVRSLGDQIKWLRNHPSIFVWFVGSDKLPRPELEAKYKSLIETIDGRPYLAAASTRESEISGPTGMKMRGPYEYVGPNYWYIDTAYGGAYGFNTETGPGPQIPVMESIRKMIPQDKLWPLNDVWSYHCTHSTGAFNKLDVFTNALTSRYGEAKSLGGYLMKSDAMSYEAMKGMFEAFRVNIPNTTGIIQWMLNSAWPSVYWQLYDYNMLPTSAYYATRKANSPIQLIYNYGNNSVYAVNEGPVNYGALKATVKLYSLASELLSSNEVGFSIDQNKSIKILDLGKIEGNAFLSLSVSDKQNNTIADNFYWLSEKQDEYAWDKTSWAYTPLKAFADFKKLNELPSSTVEVKVLKNEEKDNLVVSTQISNSSDKTAFFVSLQLKDEHDTTLYPVFWEDNYISLLPNQTKEIKCYVPQGLVNDKKLKISLSGWNIESKEMSL